MNINNNQYELVTPLIEDDTLSSMHLFSAATENQSEPLNFFKIVHLFNKSNMYHLTRQVLVDSMITQDTYCFFYHILSKTIDDFNNMYGSFAFLIARNEDEADLYLNVNVDALEYIINYIQTTKISRTMNDWDTIEETIDLATMFGMPNLVSTLRNAHSPEDQFKKLVASDKKLLHLLEILWEKYHETDSEN